VVVVARGTVVVAAITATVESVELVAPPHDARPAMRRTARSLFMPLVYTTMGITRCPDSDPCGCEHCQDVGSERFCERN
jgi:hypothetical protein